MKKRIAIIMAGGAGERFWPLSRKKYPKQLLHLNSEEYSMIEETINRISPIIALDDVFIITNELLVDEIRNKLSNLPANNVIPEPYKRNTAPCLALASAYILARYNELKPEEISIAILTADQRIFPESKFIDTVSAAMNYAEQNIELVTIGIIPTRPDTGYGYIETEKPFNKTDKSEIQKVLTFREKPTKDKAIEFIETGKFTWNSGMFFWRMDVFINEMLKHSEHIGNSINVFHKLLLEQTDTAFQKLSPAICKHYDNMPNISIDYALMEKSDDVAVCKSLFEWDDIGAWDSLDRTKQHDANGNILSGKLSVVNCKNSIIINKSKEQNIIIAGLELENIVVIATDDAVLICPKDKVQSIKQSVEDINKNFGDKWL